MSRLLTDVADLAGYDEPVKAPKYLINLHIANIHTRLLSVIACGFPTVAIERGASSFATALHIRERYLKDPIPFGLCSWLSITCEVHDICEKPRHADEP